MEPEAKISFSFSKITKKPSLLQNKPAETKKVELIECFEEQSMKIKDAIKKVEEPLVIPLKENKKNLIDRIKETRLKRAEKIEDNRPDSELTIDELAERELIRDAKNRLENIEHNTKVLTLPLKEDKLDLSGEKEPTLDDYEKIPINDYGFAMLRGMGWQEGDGIGKKPTKVNLASAPEMRPKGLGLGASKLVKKEIQTGNAVDKNGKELILKKGAFVKVIAGAHKGQYGEVLGLDDEAARVIIKTALKNEVLTLNEFLVLPITKEEYAKFSKVLNHAKFEEYKEKESKKVENDSRSNSESERQNKVHKRKDKRRHRDKSRSPRRHKSRKSSKKSYYSSDSDYGEKHYRKSNEKHRSERKKHKR